MKALKVLGLDETATLGDVKKVWRILASEHHPDRGGDPNTFNHYQRAYKAAVEYVKKPKKCTNCCGKGRVYATTGFNSILLPCKYCKGTGRVKRN